MAVLAKGNLTTEEILELAKENGIKLTKEDLEAIMKGRSKSKAMVKDKLDKLKKEKGGKISKDDFMNAV